MAHDLLSLGFVNPRSVTEEDVVVTDVSRRNSVFVVTTSRGPTYVVKQAAPGNAGAIAHEAAVLRALARSPGLGGLVPELAHSDDADARLVLRSPGDAVAWNDLPRVPRLPARALGEALAALHSARPEVEGTSPVVDRSWGVALHEPAFGELRQMSVGALDLLERLQSDDELCHRLRRLDGDADGDAFLHGDLRWENCLTIPAGGSRRRTRVLLIDWEQARRGDAAVDLGVAFGEYLRLWLDSIPIVEPSDPGRLIHRARHPIERLQPAMRALWDGYRRTSTRPVSLRHVTEMAAVRLLQTAMEHAQGLLAATAELTTLAHVAQELLRAPDEMGWVVLGLRE